ncbi:MAG: type II toxin-antitoxin system HicA family toxin [Proteobacteria bacterium]|nr:type II toxin-antitoxin system HicA family toxin [Pseudomonadota bacterium]
MNAKAKLLATIVANPKAVRFADACKAAQHLGFTHKGGAGSHVAFLRAGEPMGLNFQNRGGLIPPYQTRQLIAMIEKYGGAP